MFSINSSVLHQILTPIRSALGIRRGSSHAVMFDVDRQATTVRVANSQTSIACQLPGGGQAAHLSLPMHVLTDIKPSARHDVRFSQHGERVSVECWEGSDWRTDKHHMASFTDRPPAPEWLLGNQRHLGRVLQQAAGLTDAESTRFALGCLRLRGADGQVAATNGRQALVHAGFNFPLDEVLVPAAGLQKLRCLARCTSISVGRSADWLTISLAVGPQRWLIDLRIAQERFPCIDQCIPPMSSVRHTLSLSEADAAFVLKNLARLLGKPEDTAIVTMDFAGSQDVVLRFRSQAAEFVSGCDDRPCNWQVVELSLAESTCEIFPLRVATDYRYLLNALKLGFRRIHFQSASFPAFCEQHQRNFVWALAHPDSAIQSDPNAQRLSTSASFAAA